MPIELNGVAPLPHLGVLRVQGADAIPFLQGQLTNDFALLPDDQARLAAYCSAKGRMLASFIGFKRSADEILLVCSRDLLPAMQKRLAMFVLRAKVKITDATGDFALHGLADAAVPQPSAPWTRVASSEADIVHLYPAAGVPRALDVRPVAAPAPVGEAMTTAAWLWGEVQSGVATLSAPVVEAFVPQMLNYESVGGVNFKKGCYPGQEIVARSQFRGTIKRRAFVAHADAPMAAGQEVFDAADPEQPVGLVAQAAEAPEGGNDAIVSLQLAAQGADLRVGTADGAVLRLQPLPYRLLEDI